ncbi:hypothetical protein NKG05_07940 [Oerskovia sp. M15]
MLYADTSPAFEALRKAAATGAPAAVDLSFENSLTGSPGGGWTLTVDPNPGINGSRARPATLAGR